MDRRFTSALQTRCWVAVFAAAIGCSDQSEGVGPPAGGGSGGSGGSSTGSGASGGASGGNAGASGATSGGGGTGGSAGGKGGSGGSTGGSGGTSGSGGTAGAGGARPDAGPGVDASVDTPPPPCTGDRCICMPGERRECYSGPAATKGVGLCVAGSQTCDATGMTWGACMGEVVPRMEDCASPQDEDCDGRSDCFIVDLRGDVNRNGTVDLTDPTEDTGEDTWDATHGAIFLPNIDDDAGTCSKTAADTEIAKCNDAADEVTNGNDDLLDLARLKTVPAPSLPADASGTLTLDAKSAALVRVFKKTTSGFTVFKPTDVLTAAELKEGVELGVEGKDVQRDTTWNGIADVTLTVKSGGDAGSSASDTVRLRQAPLIFRHHLSPVKTIYAINTAGTGYTPFANGLTAALTSAGGTVPFTKLDLAGDQWAQDMMEPAYVAMPASPAPQVIRVNVRSANYGGSKGPGLRPSGRVVFTVLRGKDVGGVQHYDANHANNMDTLNSTGNFETIPPYTNGAESYPLGRVLRGRTATWYPDKMMDALIDAQGQQTILAVDTSWLLVGHVDETLSFMKASTPHGFIMLVGDPAGAVKMLQDAKTAGSGATAMFSGTSGATTIDAVLADTALMTHNQDAAADIKAQVDIIKTATGLTDAEIVKVPITHRLTSSKSVAHIPGTVNGIALSDKVFFAPEPHGPVIGGKDIFKAAFEASMTTWGITVYWVEDWDLFHALDGEIHCATNVDRLVGAGETWWTSGK